MTSNTATSSDEKLPFFLAKNETLGPILSKDDLLHPDSFRGITDPSATETQYFGFSVPEAKIHGLTYLWWHPNLKVCSGGLFVYRGVKQTTVHAELCDWRCFMRDAAIAGDLHEYRLDNGYGVKILEPNRRFHLTYDNPQQNSSIDLVSEAVLPGVMFGDGNHLDQTMKVTGTLVLRGERYPVNCYNVRDRSWGKPRPETLLPLPPSSWMTGTFRDDFSFNCTVLDQSRNNPLLKGPLALPEERTLTCGWVYRDGKLGRIVRANKKVVRDRSPTVSSTVDLDFTDEHGREFRMRGTLLASCAIQAWVNVLMVINSMRWECEGLVAYGDNQEAFWGDYLNLVASPAG